MREEKINWQGRDKKWQLMLKLIFLCVLFWLYSVVGACSYFSVLYRVYSDLEQSNLQAHSGSVLLHIGPSTQVLMLSPTSSYPKSHE